MRFGEVCVSMSGTISIEPEVGAYVDANGEVCSICEHHDPVLWGSIPDHLRVTKLAHEDVVSHQLQTTEPYAPLT